MYNRWISGYDKEISFDEFKKKLNGTKHGTRNHDSDTEEQILSNVADILDRKVY